MTLGYDYLNIQNDSHVMSFFFTDK